MKQSNQKISPAVKAAARKLTGATGAVLLSAMAANAGGVEESSQSTAIIFADGNVVEGTYFYVRPDFSGTDVLGNDTGNSAPNFGNFELRYKQDLTEKLSFAFIYERPVGLFTDYPTSNSFLSGARVDVDSNSYTALLKYRFDNNVSIYGGLRAQNFEEKVFLPGPFGLDVDVDSDTGYGYVLGVAYEIPDIALRASLTYHSKTDHDVSGTEFGQQVTFEQTLPQAVDLYLQSGITPTDLLWFKARWRDWSEGEINPPLNAAATGVPLVSYDDSITYELGWAHVFTENWTAGATFTYEQADSGPSDDLAPGGDFYSLGIFAQYEQEKFYVLGGISRSTFDDDTTATGTRFEDLDAYVANITVGYKF
ncbi:OmpP1/FadL family transporter [Ruegeria halocynthiae]|uniref:OmpP1/FadL family transporter n=1 Tax=Ruegeria halocynthiae TaxID=985054 RepID=UPI00068DE0F1|nr:outer membrane beta-barrel protein [Ruegeria halocynthiae]